MMMDHVQYTTAKANVMVTKLVRLMHNIGDSWASKGRVICRSVNSIIMYGAPIWGGVLRMEKYKNMLLQGKMVHRIISTYQTVFMKETWVVIILTPAG